MMLQTLRTPNTRIFFLSIKTLPKKLTTCRFIHLPSAGRCAATRIKFAQNTTRDASILGALFVRHNSTGPADVLPNIPEPPVPIAEVAEKLVQLQANGDPTFSSLGLGGWGPVGLVQYLIEAIHVHTSLPWWATIAATTLIMKLLVLRPHIKAQRMHGVQQKHAAKLQKLQKDMMAAQLSGDMSEAALLMQEQKLFTKQIGLTPGAMLLNSGIQGAASITCFLALRGITASSLESLRVGGFLWITDLTVPDPLYVLPVLTCTSIAILTETMMAGGNLDALRSYKYLIRIVPLITFPFMMNFASGIQVFWLATNLITLTQFGILRIPSVRAALNLPKPSTSTPMKGFKEQYQEILKEVQTRKELKEAARREDHLATASRMPVQKTYTYNPVQTSSAKKQKLRKSG